jgi:hypothetical protein
MKNKKLTYILLPVVAIIWGFVIFQFFFKNENEFVAPSFQEFNLQEKQDSLIFIAVNFDFTDPFLKRKIISSNVKPKAFPKKPSKAIFKRKPIVKQIIWPKIEYGGTVNETKGLVNINGRLNILKESERSQNVTLLNLYSDSIKVQFKSEQKVIAKNKF